ncbi:two-component system response regulator [Chromatium weissei]|nr:two-component system response regulator [Chromatium weissei]
MIPSAIERPTILVVDDTPANLSLLNTFLGKDYRILLASHGMKALQLAKERQPDLILLDIMMPDMDGYEVCRRLKADEALQRIPVLFLTAKNEISDEEQGFALGAVDFIHKPISLPIVTARVRSHLQLKVWQDFLLDQNAWLRREVEKRLSDINRFRDASILTMVSLAEFRDECTGNHIQRTQEYVRLLAQHCAAHPRYQHQFTASYIELISKSAALHDVGKIAIPDHILLKSGKLTDEEFVIMRTHAVRGYEMLARAGEHLGEHGEFLKLAKDIAHYHHEKWDGSGYPDGLQGHAIPIAARLMAVADVFDALLTRRPYKEPFPMHEVIAIMKQGSGNHFDPEVIDAFLVLLPQLEEIARRDADA